MITHISLDDIFKWMEQFPHEVHIEPKDIRATIKVRKGGKAGYGEKVTIRANSFETFKKVTIAIMDAFPVLLQEKGKEDI